jgi:3-ketosteroid 9alpha-monooxygenase subunit B
MARPYAGWEPYVCGPDPYLTAVRAALGQLGVPAKRVRTERFLSLAENPFDEPPFDEARAAGGGGGGRAAALSVELDGTTTTLPWPPGTRMLDVLIDAGLAAPYSCRQGICGACACQLVAGEVEMAHNEVLEAADLADGYVLACQAVPLTPEVRVAY